jgi:putative selenate reductase
MLVEDGRVTSNVCFQMELGEADASGRPRPIKIDGSQFELHVDSVISAIGQRVNLDFFPEEELKIDPHSHETQLENVFAGGDAVRGASTLIKAIGDGKKIAETIQSRALDQNRISGNSNGKISDFGALQKRRARRQVGMYLPEIGFDQRAGFDLVIQTLDDDVAKKEAARCLYCDEICSVCVSVCPNRANLEFRVDPVRFKVQQVQQVTGKITLSDIETVRIEQNTQVMNIADYCNECGNCATFCPTSGAPYKDKAKLHISKQSFDHSDVGFHFTTADQLLWKDGRRNGTLTRTAQGLIFESNEIKARIDSGSYVAEVLELKTESDHLLDTRTMLEMAVLYQHVKNQLPFSL